MEVRLSALAESKRYNILAGLVVPRPIAWITTLDEAGRVNLAPFSFFQVMATRDCHVGIGISDHEDGRRKDTLVGMESIGEFVVNLADVDLATEVDGSSLRFPPGVSEAAAVGMTLLPCTSVRVPRVAQAPAALECELQQVLPMGEREWWVIGRVTHATLREDIVDDQLHVDYERYRPLGRLIGRQYLGAEHRFEVSQVGDGGRLPGSVEA